MASRVWTLSALYQIRSGLTARLIRGVGYNGAYLTKPESFPRNRYEIPGQARDDSVLYCIAAKDTHRAVLVCACMTSLCKCHQRQYTVPELTYALPRRLVGPA